MIPETAGIHTGSPRDLTWETDATILTQIDLTEEVEILVEGLLKEFLLLTVLEIAEKWWTDLIVGTLETQELGLEEGTKRPGEIEMLGAETLGQQSERILNLTEEPELEVVLWQIRQRDEKIDSERVVQETQDPVVPEELPHHVAQIIVESGSQSGVPCSSPGVNIEIHGPKALRVRYRVEAATGRVKGGVATAPRICQTGVGTAAVRTSQTEVKGQA